jgi:anti-sigma factor RsiW
MSKQNRPVNNEDLVAFADGQLEPARERLVADYLHNNPDAVHRVEVYRQQSTELHRLFDPSLSAPIPQHLLPPDHPSFGWRKNLALALAPRWSWGIAAASAWVALGASMGWMLKAHQTSSMEPLSLALQSQSHALLRQASVAHAVYAPEVMHPVEVSAKDEAHLTKWLSKRLDKKLSIPSFTEQGFHLVGGRLLPAEPGTAAAQFMYENKNMQRFTLYVRAMERKEADTSFRYGENKGIGVFYWVDHDWGYALSGKLDRAALLELADVAYRQFNL